MTRASEARRRRAAAGGGEDEHGGQDADQGHPELRPGEQARHHLLQALDPHRRPQRRRQNHDNRVPEAVLHRRAAPERAVRPQFHPRPQGGGGDGDEGADQVEVQDGGG